MNALDSSFAWFLESTLRGSLLALAVFALQAALRGRLPAFWHSALWLPVVLVLASPMLPRSAWSLENRFVRPAPAVPVIALDSDILEDDASEAPAPLQHPDIKPNIDWWRMAALTWLAGAGSLLVFALAGYAGNMRRLRRGAVRVEAGLPVLIEEAAASCRLRRLPQLLVSTAVQSPAIAGFLRPTLLLPADFPGAFTPAEARLVLLHELMHLRRRDLPLNWLLCLLQALHWCNPLLWFFFARMRADREVACDEQVLAASGDDCRADYGHALLRLAAAPARLGWSLGFVGIFERASDVRARVRAIAAYRRAHRVWNVLAVALIAVLGLVGATRAQLPAARTKPRSVSVPDPGAIHRKLDSIVIPKLELHDVSVQNAFDLLKAKSAEFDTAEPNPAKRGVNVMLKLDAPRSPDAAAAPHPSDARITVTLTNVPLIEAFKYLAGLADLKFRILPNAVQVVPLYAVDPLVVKRWNVDPEAAWLADPNAREDLVASGVTFPAGATAAFSKDRRRLVMKNTQDNIDLVDTILAEASASPDDEADPVISGRALLARKATGIILPQFDLRDATLREAVDLLKKKSVELDTREPDPARRGVNIILKLDGAASTGAQESRITLALRNVALLDALVQVAASAGVRCKLEDYAIALLSPLTDDATLITKEWKLGKAAATALVPIPGFDCRATLEARGVTFPKFASVTFIASRRSLIMRNTEANMDHLDELLEAIESGKTK